MPKSIPKGLTREHVYQALADLDAGIEHAFGRPTGYELVHEGKRYPPKAVIGIAFRHLTGAILHHRQFSGGEAPGQANFVLRSLGFQVERKADEPPEPPVDLTAEEYPHLIADYFDLLRRGVSDQDYGKPVPNWRLPGPLAERPTSCVEFNRRYVSAVLVRLGLPYIAGYQPAWNYPRNLVDAVRTYLEREPAFFSVLDQATDAEPGALPKLANWERVFEAPPEDRYRPLEPGEPWRFRRGQKVDYVRRDATNRRLGKLGEEFAVELERRRLRSCGRADLAKQVEWVSITSGDGLGFDVLSFDERDGSERFIEVKTTAQGKYFPFCITANELRCSEATAPQYHLYRLFRFSHQPRLYVLHGALSKTCTLDPLTYRATVAAR